MIFLLLWMMVKGFGVGFFSVYSYFVFLFISLMVSVVGSVVDGNYFYGNMQMENVNGFSWSINSIMLFGQMMYQIGSGVIVIQICDGNMVMDVSGVMFWLLVGINVMCQIVVV